MPWAADALPSSPVRAGARPHAPRVVLDTNAVLDWLLFRDPAAQALGRAIQAGQVSWIVNTAIVAEHQRLFASALAPRWSAEPQALNRACADWAQIDLQPLRFCGLRCSDPDDQVFIDFAIARQATWLVTRDKALLRLRRRARDFGVQVASPAEWVAGA